MNNVSIIGRLTADPRTITTKTGRKVSHFSVAINNPNSVIYVNITAWSPICDTVERFLRKGQNVGISGRLATDSSGKLEVIVNTIHLLEPHKETGKNSEEDTNLLDFPL